VKPWSDVTVLHLRIAPAKMNRKLLLIFIALQVFSMSGITRVWAQENTKCPIMTEDDVDKEETVEFEGLKVGFCCGRCGKLFLESPRYYIKAAPELLPQFKGMEEKLGLDKIVLLPQKFCPMKTRSLICPDSPVLEYKGAQIYFFDQRALEKWKLDPDGNAGRAVKAGLLPQLKDK
jgi:hypothetical protein